MTTPQRLSLALPGQKARPAATLDFVRELSQSDIDSYAESPTSAPVKTLDRIKDSHHAVAKCLAMGMSHVETAAHTGYAAATISLLKNSPAFQDLIELYRQNDSADVAMVQNRMTAILLDAMQMVALKFEEAGQDGEPIPIGQLKEIIFGLADRTGHGPSSKTTNVNVNVDLAERMKAARQQQAPRPLAISPPKESP